MESSKRELLRGHAWRCHSSSVWRLPESKGTACRVLVEVGAAEPEAVQYLSHEPTPQAYFLAYQAAFLLMIIWVSLQILPIGQESLAGSLQYLGRYIACYK